MRIRAFEIKGIAGSRIDQAALESRVGRTKVSVRRQCLEIRKTATRNGGDQCSIGGEINFTGRGVMFQVLGIVADLVRISNLITVILMVGNCHMAFSFRRVVANLFRSVRACLASLRPDVIGICRGRS